MKRIGATSIYRGVFWTNREKRFIARAKMESRGVHVGSFKNELDAALAYDDFCRKNNLDRRLNFPDPEPENLIPNTRLIRLTQGQFAVVDDDDFEWLNQYEWYAVKEDRSYYAARTIYEKGRVIQRQMQMEILGGVNGVDLVDHKNHNGLHNYRSNIRFCTFQQNLMNHKPKKLTSNFKGVHWSNRSKKWASSIGFNYKTIHIGYFNSEEDAARAYDTKAKELHGEFAYLNFPNE